MNHPWGLPPSGPPAAPIARRKDPVSRLQLGFVSMRNHEGPLPDTAITMFEHYDKRLWTAEIMPLTPGHPLSQGKLLHFLRFQSPGVVPVAIISDGITAAKRCAANFANMQQPAYELLCRDARGSLDHPAYGKLVIVIMEEVLPESLGPAQPFRPTPEGPQTRRYGRYSLGHERIEFFPGWLEVDAILETVCTRDSVPLNTYIQEFELPQHFGVFDRLAYQGFVSRQAGPQQADLAKEVTSLQELLYPEVRGRENRVIQL